MNTIKFNKQLYPKEIILQCINDYNKHLHAEFEDINDYLLVKHPPEEQKIALEFGNYVLAMVRANARS